MPSRGGGVRRRRDESSDQERRGRHSPEPVARWIWKGLHRVGVLREELAPEDVCTLEIMSRVLKEDSCCVDVGCSQGKILTQMTRLAPRGEHYAFEPLPSPAQRLKSVFPLVNVFEVALADFSGEADFQHVVTNPEYSGLRRRTYPSDRERVETIQVQVERLDEVVPRETRIDFLKIDVEGAELGVLRGAAETIKRNRPFIVFEHGKGASDYYGTTPEMIHEFLVGDCSLRISLMSDWLEGRPPLGLERLVAQYGGAHWYFLAHP